MQEIFDPTRAGAAIEARDGGAGPGAAPLIPCDAGTAYNFERQGEGVYCLTLPVPGFDEDDVLVRAAGGTLRVTGASSLVDPEGEVLHRGLAGRLGLTFLMTRPLDVADVELRCGLLRIWLRAQPGGAVEAAIPPRLIGVEAFALAA